MRGAIVEAAGQSPVYGSFADPDAGDGEALVTVTASALSQLARARASGRHYSASGIYPFVAGVDGVGRLADGRRVYFVLPRAPFGAMAEQSVVADGQWIALPDGIDDETAAVIANPGMSSWAALTERARIAPGETVLINGATGASGSLAVRIARHLGAGRVIATGRNAAALDALGADAAIILGDDGDALERDFRAAFADSVDIVLDYLWGASARSLLAGAAKGLPAQHRLRFVQIGSVTGAEVALDAAVLRSTAIEMMGSGIGSVAIADLVKAIGGVLAAATGEAGLSLPYRAVPLRDVAATWHDDGERIVYVTAG